ncbi:unnamed protein product [Urochloa decumbens]|uniref:Uncharacterized protein n=1 Tax=Urochloa decumbens TaxID=240449 RepID=A0ABC9B138_9POAL
MEMDASSHSSNWDVAIEVEEDEFVPLTLQAKEMARWNRTCICRVPEWVKRVTSIDAYRPWMVSLGPFHHGHKDLVPMEEHKRRAVQHIVKRSGKRLEDFISAIEEVVNELRQAYGHLDNKWCGEKGNDRFIKMMVRDGCFLLEFIRTDQLRTAEEVDDDYAENDPIFSDLGFYYVWPRLRTDIITMENQLPLLVLQRLLHVQHGQPKTAKEVNEMVMNLLDCEVVEGMNKLAFHPLDIFHRSFKLCAPPRRDNQVGECFKFCASLRRDKQVGERDEVDSVMPSAVELREAGIRFERCSKNVREVSFTNGVLYMPRVIVDDETDKMYLNMMAFERLYHAAGNDVTDYIFFMDNIINTGKDVELLRSDEVMEQTLGSDEEVAKLFNTMNKGALMGPSSKLHDVHREVKAYCKKPWKRLRASFVHTYLSTPWVFISLVAAFILLGFTILQTVYTVLPFYTKS